MDGGLILGFLPGRRVTTFSESPSVSMDMLEDVSDWSVSSSLELSRSWEDSSEPLLDSSSLLSSEDEVDISGEDSESESRSDSKSVSVELDSAVEDSGLYAVFSDFEFAEKISGLLVDDRLESLLSRFTFLTDLVADSPVTVWVGSETVPPLTPESEYLRLRLIVALWRARSGVDGGRIC